MVLCHISQCPVKVGIAPYPQIPVGFYSGETIEPRTQVPEQWGVRGAHHRIKRKLNTVEQGALTLMIQKRLSTAEHEGNKQIKDQCCQEFKKDNCIVGGTITWDTETGG